MRDASEILFETNFNGKPLFKNQLDLAQHLLNDADTFYFIKPQPENQYAKALSRLKTYISQLLSPNVIRNITEGFRKGLLSLVTKELNDPVLAKQIIGEVLEDLQTKNSNYLKTENKISIEEQLKSDFTSANYVAIVTAKPLEIEAELDYNSFTLRQIFINDLFEILKSDERDFKNYRLIFALESSCHLFWRGMQGLLFKFIKDNIKDKFFLDALYARFTLKTKTHINLLEQDTLSDDYLIEVTNEVLCLLNSNRYVVVFLQSSPLFNLPLVVINPAETKSARVYCLLNPDNEQTSVYKYSIEEILLWRLFVWDKLKSKPYIGKSIPFTDILIEGEITS